MNARFFIIPLLLILLQALTVCGEISVSLPLEGHYRAGHYTPVRLTTRDEQGTMTLSARGAMPTEIPASGNFDGIIPWLIVGSSLRDPIWISSSSGVHALTLPLKALDEDERLVGFAGSESDISKLLFPGKTIVPVALDLSRPLLQPAQAWEALDAIVLSESAAARLDERQRAALLCSGMTIAIHMMQPPDLRWRPRRVGDYWVLHWNVAGPRSVLSPDAYLPTYDWERGWPPAFRHQVVLFGVIFAILGMGIVLWPSRWAVASFLVLVIAMAGGFGYWYSRQSPILKLQAGVSICAGEVEQRDTWSWLAPLRSTIVTNRSGDVTRPVFASLGQVDTTSARLICGPDGTPDRFTFALTPGQSLALLDRTLQVGIPNDKLQPASPLFATFVDQLYVRAGEQIAGQFQERGPIDQQIMPVIVLH